MIARFAGRYALLQRLGRGGMGDVFLARDLTTGGECALKRLHHGVASENAALMEEEFRILARVRHPGVVAVYELGFDSDGRPFFTMEYVPGVRADRALARGDREALAFTAVQTALALEALHAARVVHGDLKPSNLLVVSGPLPDTRPSGVRLLDFGLAHLVQNPSAGHRGTPGFAAPEVVRGEAPTPASDLYGLGATLFTLACGRRPFEAASVSGILRMQRSGPPEEPLEDAGLPAEFVRIVLRLLSEVPAERGHDAREVRRELERVFPAARKPLRERIQPGRPVGRSRELARLESWLADPNPRARLQIVTGAAGTGVSALLDEIAARAAISGRSVLRLSGTLSAGTAARILIRRLMGEAGAETPTEGVWPERLRTWLASDDTALHADDLSPLVEAAFGWMAAAASRGGVPMLFVDDSEALDPVTRALIRRLVLAPAAHGLRLVSARHQAPPAMVEEERTLSAAGFAETIELRSLEHDDVERLASSLLSAPAPRILVEWLWSKARGNPAFTIELLKYAADAGAVADDDSGTRVDEAALGALEAPTSFESSLLARWRALPPPDRDAAAALAVWNRAVTPKQVRTLVPGADDATMTRLVREGLASRDADGAFAFSTPSLRERVLDALDRRRRRALHEAVLRTGLIPAVERFEHLRAAGRTTEALAAAEELAAEGSNETLALAAAALAEGSDPTLAARWHERAGRARFERGGHSAAIPPLERAIALDPEGEMRHARRAALAEALFRAGEYSRLEAFLVHAFEDSPPAPVRVRLEVVAASLQTVRGHYDAAARQLSETLARCETFDDPLETGNVAMSLANALRRLERGEDAMRAVERAVDAFRRVGFERGALRAAGLRAQITRLAGDDENSARELDEAIERARGLRLRFAIEELLNTRAAMRIEVGSWGAARDDLAEALQLALEDGRTANAAGLMASRAVLEGLTGRPRFARTLAHAALRIARASNPSARSAALRALALAHRVAGRSRAAERLIRRSLSLTGAPHEERDWARFELARILLATGRADEVRALRRTDDAVASFSSAGDAAVVLLAGRAAVHSGDIPAGERALQDVDYWRAGRRQALLSVLALQLRTEIALARGRIADGVAAARETLDAFDALPAPADRAMAALDFARLRAADEIDERIPVTHWLEEAAGGFQRIGDLRSRERSLALLVRRLKRSHPTEGHPGRAHDLILAVRRLFDSLSDMRELAQRAMQLLVEQLDAEHGVLLLVDEAVGQLVVMAEHGAVDALTRRTATGYSRRVVERVAKGGGAVLLGDAVTDPESLSESIMNLHLHSILCVPMYVAGRVMGAVYLDDSRHSDAFSDGDRALLEGFAQLMAVAFEKSRGQQEVERTNRLLVGENLQLRQQAGVRFSTQNLIAASSEMQRVMAVVERVAHSDAYVLLTGENGTGKEMIALTLHHAGRRRDRPFVAVNCGAIPEALLESELFGILPRVATGVGQREGRFVQANGGTLFLDEVGDMPLLQQVALLRVLSSREVTPVGGGPPIPINVRVIAASNRDLAERVARGAFREDLYHRLNVIPIEVPPLRERKADIPALAHHFAAEFALQQERETPELSPELLASLMQSDWPGNVRELRNYIERIMAMNPGATLRPTPPPRDLEAPPALRLTRGRTLAAVVEELEHRLINQALARSAGNQAGAARSLGLTEQSLRYRLRKFAARQVRRKRRTR